MEKDEKRKKKKEKRKKEEKENIINQFVLNDPSKLGGTQM
jgi:hypothetical protein